MPRQPDQPPGGRIYARLDRFDVECPTCGRVIVGHATFRGHGIAAADALEKQRRQGRLSIGRRGNQATAYNPITSTLTCPWCLRRYQVGVVLWPAAIGDKGVATPEDQRPTRQQAIELRNLARGIAAEKAKRRAEAVNVFVESQPGELAECRCPRRGWKPSCPVHGTAAQAERMAAQAKTAVDTATTAGSAPAGSEQDDDQGGSSGQGDDR